MPKVRREGGGIEPPERQSTAPPIGFEGRDAHQSHIPPTEDLYFNEAYVKNSLSFILV